MSEKHRRVNREQGPATPPESQRLADEVAELEAQLAEKKKKQAHGEAFGANKPWEISIGKDGRRTDYEGFRARWQESLERPDDFNYDLGEDKAYNDRDMTYSEMIREAHRLNELGDAAGLEELWNVLQDKLVTQAAEEDWSDTSMIDQLESYEKHFFLVKSPELSAPSAPTAELVDDEFSQSMEFSVSQLESARQGFLEYVAKHQKDHWNKGRIKAGGNIAYTLRAMGLDGVADRLTRTTDEERFLGENYAQELKRFEDFALYGIVNGTDEYKASKAAFLTEIHAQDVAEIAELQKESAKKPMNKYLRGAGYVAAGVVGGLIGGIAGFAGATAASMELRRRATRRNALTEVKGNNGLQVDKVARDRQASFADSVKEVGVEGLDAGMIVQEHIGDMHDDISDNRKRMWKPLAAVALAFAATRWGVNHMPHNGEEVTPESTPTPTPSESASATPSPSETPNIDIVTPEADAPETSLTDSYAYPFHWAVEQFSEANAASELHRLGEIASQNGYDVAWHAMGDGIDTNDWISINGISDTDYVVNILNQFR